VSAGTFHGSTAWCWREMSPQTPTDKPTALQKSGTSGTVPSVPLIPLRSNWDKRHRVKVSLCQNLYYFGIWDTLHPVPSVPHGDGSREGRNPALCLSGYFPDEVPHTGDIPAVSAARHVMNVPVVLRDFPGPGPAGAGTRIMNAMGG